MHAKLIAVALLAGSAGWAAHASNVEDARQLLRQGQAAAPTAAAPAAAPAPPRPAAPLSPGRGSQRPQAEKISFSGTGAPDNKGFQLSAVWVRAAAISKQPRKPTVIAMHGCGGLYSIIRANHSLMTPRTSAMVRDLRNAGYNVLLPDSMSSRGLHSVCTDTPRQSDAFSMLRVRDIQASLRWLSRQDDVDQQRIALLGWADGGTTVMKLLAAPPERDLPQPKAAVAFYPNCTAFTKARIAYHPRLPLLILTGSEDDWTPAERCQALAAAVGPALLKLNVYQASYHEFDAPGMAMQVRMDVPNPQQPGQGVTSGVNTETKVVAYRDMFHFLHDELK